MIHTLLSSFAGLTLAILPATAATAPAGTPQTDDRPKAVAEHLEAARDAAGKDRIDLVLLHLEQGMATRDRRAGYDQARLELWGIRWRDDRVVALLGKGEVDEARELFDRSLDVFESRLAQRRTEALKLTLEAAEREQARDASRDARSRQVDRRLRSARRSLDRAESLLDASQRHNHRTVYAARKGQSALRRYEMVARSVAAWIEDYGQDKRHALMLREVGLRAERGAVQAMLRIADSRTTQGDFREALQWVGRVQLRDPDNERARELQRTIQIAMASSGPWVGGGVLVAPRQ